jgi:glycosyltransferase involved in cell wall biosynthesis
MAPDPIDRFPPLSRVEARASAGLPPGGRLIASLGMQSARKGIDLLLEAFGRSPLAEEDRLLLAGPGAARSLRVAQERLSERSRSRVLVVDRFLSHEELHRYASAADVIVTLYRDASLPSGIAIRALAAERPLLAADRGWFAPMVRAFELGSTCAIDDPERVGASIVAALDASSRYRPSEAARRLLAFQSPRQHVLSWRAAVAGRELDSHDGEALSWEWVLSAVRDERLRAPLELS